MKVTTCPHCRSTKHERAEEQSRTVAPCEHCGPIFEAGRLDERARIRKTLVDLASQSKSAAARSTKAKAAVMAACHDAATRAYQNAAEVCK